MSDKTNRRTAEGFLIGTLLLLIVTAGWSFFHSPERELENLKAMLKDVEQTRLPLTQRSGPFHQVSDIRRFGRLFQIHSVWPAGLWHFHEHRFVSTPFQNQQLVLSPDGKIELMDDAALGLKKMRWTEG